MHAAGAQVQVSGVQVHAAGAQVHVAGAQVPRSRCICVGVDGYPEEAERHTGERWAHFPGMLRQDYTLNPDTNCIQISQVIQRLIPN